MYPNSYRQGSIYYRWISLLFVLCLFSVLARTSMGETVISGTAFGFEGKMIRVLYYQNYITNIKRSLATADVRDDGSFELKFNGQHSEYLILEVDFLEAELLVIPGSKFVVAVNHSKNSANRIMLTYLETPDRNLNVLIPEFEEAYVELTDKLYPYIVKRGKWALVDSMFDDLAVKHKKNAGNFMTTYVDYKIAMIKQLTHKTRKAKFEKEYIIEKPVREDNIAYMSFINNYFSNYLNLLSQETYGSGITELVNKKKDVKGILEILKKDTRLANDTLRELVLLKGLYEIFYEPAFQEQMVLDLLDSIWSITNIEGHKNLAMKIKLSLEKLRPGAIAPEFALKDETGEVLNLNSFIGKYVYLSFWDTKCATCLQDMQVMPSLIKKYGDEIAFVHVSLDRDYETMKEYLIENTLPDPENKGIEYYLHFGMFRAVKINYDIERLPLYIFLDRGSHIIKSPAEPPSGEIERTFMNALLQKKSKGSIDDPGGN